MAEHAVVIAGGGPTGMMLAAELALAGVDVAIVERRATPELDGSRAGGLHARTLEILEQRGVVERFISQGQVVRSARFAGNSIDVSDLPTRHAYVLGLWQKHFERILAGWLEELPVRWYRGREVTGFVQDELGVEVALSDGGVLRAQYLVGCDGGRSLVRKNAGIDFPGWEPTHSCLLAEVEMAKEPALGMRRGASGVHAISKLGEGATLRVMVTERQTVSGREPTLGELSAALVDVYGADFGVHHPTWITRFNDAARQAAAYRERRVLLAGDAAHVHYPVGGQGLNLGVQDAVNLGWKLAQVVKGTSPESLLDTYHRERHPVAARVLQDTLAGSGLQRTDERSEAVGGLLGELLSLDEPRRRWGARLSGLDIRYHLGEGHPLVGRRVPDLDLETVSGATRMFSLLHAARPVLLNLGAPGAFDDLGHGELCVVDARGSGAWELPGVGAVVTPGAVLVRPDGYVAWVGDRARHGLADALTSWFGHMG